MKSCAKANYKYTAKYLKVGNETFQQKKGKLLDQLIPYIESCSPYSSLILCSLYLPKCVPGSARPMLPCRQVCLDFADKCKTELTLVSTVGMTIALCDLLPFYDGTPNKCIMPESFKMKDSLQLCMFNLICPDKGLMLETSALKTFYSGQFTLSTQLIILKMTLLYSPTNAVTQFL